MADTARGQRGLRMPLGFGAGAGPRHNPWGPPFGSAELETLTLSVRARTTTEGLQAILPRGVYAAGDVLTVEATRLRHVAWLAGRGYNIVTVKTPAEYRTRYGEVIEADYVNVLWENLADPIITGREELGFAKLYAEIDDVHEPTGGRSAADARWDGFTFVSIRAHDLVVADPPVGRPRLHYKYVPATGRWDDADVAYAVVTPAENPTVTVLASWAGEGSFTFHAATFAELPTLRHVVNRLAALPIHGFLSASLVKTRGGKSLADQRPAEDE
ncbi:MAG: acetoacetate decarboxylase family protein [Dehalococcoidia bacterium]